MESRVCLPVEVLRAIDLNEWKMTVGIWGDKLAVITWLLQHFFRRQRLLVKLLAYFYADFFHTVCAMVLMFLFKYSSMFSLYLWFRNRAVCWGNWWFHLPLAVN